MDNDLLYIEMVHKARHAGNLSCDSWESSILAAFAWSTRYNALGASLVDWLDGFKDGPTFLARFHLATECVKQKLCKDRDSPDVALEAMVFYQNRTCPKCDGRGVIDQSQVECPFCTGTGYRDMPTGAVYHAYKAIDGALEWLDSQLRFRMRGAPHPPKEVTYILKLDTDGEYLSDIPLAGQRTHPRLKDNWAD